MEVRVTARAGPIDAAFVRELAGAFHGAHEKAFGYAYAGRQKIELVNCAVSGFGRIDRPALARLPVERRGQAEIRARRRVFFDGKWHDTPIYDRTALGAGARVAGPGVIEEFGSTTVIFPGQTLVVDPHAILIVHSANRPKDKPALEVVR